MVTNDLYFSVSAQAPRSSNSESIASCPALPRRCPLRVHWFFAFFQPQLTLAIHPLPSELTLTIHLLPSELTLAIPPLPFELTLAIHLLPSGLTLAIHPLLSELTLAVQPLHSVPIHP